MSKIAVIGAGFAGLSAAAYLSAKGHDVSVYEKNSTPGGRARQLISGGYTFDMGPSWYWMPDIFEKFFSDFGYHSSDFYSLKLLDPSLGMVFSDDDAELMNIPADFDGLCTLFESVEEGSAGKLRAFMREAEYKYEKGMKVMAYKPGLSFTEFADAGLIWKALGMDMVSSFSKHVRKYFTHPRLIALMEFPVLFLGGMPQNTPALYSMMNYAGLKLGTWYPEGGFGEVVKAVMEVAAEHGATFQFNANVDRIVTEGDRAKYIIANGEQIAVDAVIGAADYQHIEHQLLPLSHRNYSEQYWEKKTFAPSCLIFHLGISNKLSSLQHHTLFFEEDLYQHSAQIYLDAQWPTRPLFYVCRPTRSDDTLSPAGHDILFLLMPIAPGLDDGEEVREKYFHLMMNRLEKLYGQPITPHIDFKKSYCVSDFIADYHSYKGNGYGLANTLMQTAMLKPKIRNKKVRNLFYAGQLTVPGPGVPPALISGKMAADQLDKYLNRKGHEAHI
ncbi:MAG: phytoene desaturase family protein [Balneolales bacterium]